MVFFSGAQTGLVNYSHQLSGGCRSQLMRKAVQRYEQETEKSVKIALKPDRKISRDDGNSVKLARYIERINDEISLMSTKLETNCRTNVRETYSNPKVAFDSKFSTESKQ